MISHCPLIYISRSLNMFYKVLHRLNSAFSHSTSIPPLWAPATSASFPSSYLSTLEFPSHFYPFCMLSLFNSFATFSCLHKCHFPGEGYLNTPKLCHKYTVSLVLTVSHVPGTQPTIQTPLCFWILNRIILQEKIQNCLGKVFSGEHYFSF